ncbi:hypothetical protein D3C86_1385960 [compost metagenome]
MHTLRLLLFVRADENALARPNRPPGIGAQFKPLAALLPLGIHHVPEVELALATVVGAELDVLLTAGVVQPQLVVGRGAQHVALFVVHGDVVGVLAVVQGVGDVGAVRVALFEGHRHFGAGDQRQVQAVGVAGIRSGQAQPHAFLAGLPGVAVEQELHAVAPFDVDFGVGVVFLRVADPRRDGAGDLRFGQQWRAKTHAFRIGDGLELHHEAGIAGGAGAELGDHGAAGVGLGRAANDFQDLAGGQGGAAAGAAEAGLVVEVTFVLQTGVEVAGFRRQVFVELVAVAEGGVGFGVVVGLAVGGGRAAGVVDLAVQVSAGVAMLVGADIDLAFHHLMSGLQGPDAVLLAAAQAGG